MPAPKLVLFHSVNFPNTPEAWLGFLAGLKANPKRGQPTLCIGDIEIEPHINATLYICALMAAVEKEKLFGAALSVRWMKESPPVAAPIAATQPATKTMDIMDSTPLPPGSHTFGQVLRWLRRRYNIQQIVLSEAMGYQRAGGQPMIHKVEHGKVGVTPDNRARIISGLKSLGIPDADIARLPPQ